ncbi:MAG: divergent polysaccharide deacetylase family protein [Thiovulaceae bacterium]|nr:divergent polysaccharide deacetylase family protein [Sulfurimonadaceae bacterium]
MKIFTWSAIAILALMGFIGLGYYAGYVDGSKYTDTRSAKHKESNATEPFSSVTSTQALPKKADEPKIVTSKEPKLPLDLPKSTQNISLKQEEDIKERLKTVLNEEQNRYAIKGASHEYEGNPEKINKPIKVEKKVPQKLEYPSKKIEKTPKKTQHVAIQESNNQGTFSGKPKLAIIIDDVSFSKEVKAIKKLDLTVTMSFLPPNLIHPDSAVLASKESFYMVHLPMEAVSFNASEPITLKVEDSQALISQRVDDVVKLFPRVKYLNNHTGSKFTADEVAMNRLIFALNAHHIEFIDSRTIAQTKAPKVMRAYGERYIGRDVFLDHTMNVEYVKKQIQEAVKVAKSKGYAVAIGHPHPNTLEALRESKELLSQVELVQINKI